MGLSYWAVFFYGMLIDSNSMRRLVRDAATAYKPRRRREQFGSPDEENDETEENEEEGEWEYLGDGIHFVDEKWCDEGDPVAIGSNHYFDRDLEPFIYVRETYHCTERTSLDDVAFDLEIDIDKWDALIKEKCERFDIPWTKPAFQILIGGSG